MHKLQNGSQVTGRPARKPRVGTRGYFSESNDQAAPSYPGQDWFNDCIDEFANAIEQANIPYDPQRLDHLARAIAEAKANWGADIVSQAEAQAGTATTARKWTAQRVRQAIVAWWDSIPKGTAFNKNFGSTAGTVCPGNDSRLSDAREWLADTVSQAEAEGGESNAPRKWTAQRVHQAFNKYGLGTHKSSDISNLALLPKISGFYQTTSAPNGQPPETATTWTALVSSINLSRACAIIMGAGDSPSLPTRNNSIYYTWMNRGLWEAPILELLHEGNERQIGVNQEYYNVIQDKSGGVVYTNNTTKPILVMITTTPAQTHDNALLVRANSSSDFITVGASSGAASTGISAVIPPGFEYKLNVPNNQIQLWVELR
ncbi:TPA: hypothetical protein ACMDR0_002071 [Vibrio cholerae]